MPGCGVAGPDTKTGMLFIDHEGPFRVPGCLVRGLLCCTCNSGLGRAEAGPHCRGSRPPTNAEIAYLSRPFWREPESLVSRQWKADYRAARRATVDELDKYSRRRRSRFDGLDRVDAIGRALDEGIRQADIERGTRFAGSAILKAAREHRARTQDRPMAEVPTVPGGSLAWRLIPGRYR